MLVQWFCNHCQGSGAWLNPDPLTPDSALEQVFAAHSSTSPACTSARDVFFTTHPPFPIELLVEQQIRTDLARIQRQNQGQSPAAQPVEQSGYRPRTLSAYAGTIHHLPERRVTATILKNYLEEERIRAEYRAAQKKTNAETAARKAEAAAIKAAEATRKAEIHRQEALKALERERVLYSRLASEERDYRSLLRSVHPFERPDLASSDSECPYFCDPVSLGSLTAD